MLDVKIFDPQWETLHSTKQWGQYPNEHLVRFVKTRQWPNNAWALDLGCGAGAQTFFLAEEGFSVMAVDASVAALSRIVRRLNDFPTAYPNVHTYCSNITAMRHEMGPFELIVDVCTLQHLSLDAARDVIMKAKQWLKPNGWFFSIMASEHPDAAIAGINPRRIERGQIAKLFEGYQVAIGWEVQQRPNGQQVSHYIVEAQR